MSGFTLSLIVSLSTSLWSGPLLKFCIDLTKGGLAVLVLLLNAIPADLRPTRGFVSAAEKLWAPKLTSLLAPSSVFYYLLDPNISSKIQIRLALSLTNLVLSSEPLPLRLISLMVPFIANWTPSYLFYSFCYLSPSWIDFGRFVLLGPLLLAVLKPALAFSSRHWSFLHCSIQSRNKFSMSVFSA